MSLLLPETRTEEQLGEPITVTGSRELEYLNPTPEQARAILKAIRRGASVKVQPVLRIETTYPSWLQRKLGAKQLYLGRNEVKALRVLAWVG